MIRIRGLIWGLVAVTLMVACVRVFTGPGRFDTDLLTLLPTTERNPVAEEVVGRLSEAAGARLIFLVGHPQAALARDGARRLGADLARSQAFRSVQAELPPLDMERVFAVYRPYRFHLLGAEDRRTLTAPSRPDLEGRLVRKLYSPVRFAFTTPLQEDPFGFFDAFLQGLPLRGLQLDMDDGMLVTRDATRTYALVHAELNGSAYDFHVQDRVMQAIDHAETALHAGVPDAVLLRTGTIVFAAAARHSAQADVDLISWGSLIGISILLLLVFRSASPLILGLLSVGIGVCAAGLAVIALYGKLHLLTAVFGASLIGEAVDYSIQFFAARLGAGASWEAGQGLRRIGTGLTLALATSLLGYTALSLAHFPGLTQIALFAAVGLTAAYLTVILLLPAVLTRPQRGSSEALLRLPQRALDWWAAHVGRTAVAVFVAGLVAVSALGWLRLRGEDDIHLLTFKSPVLATQEADIRRLTGLNNSSQFILVEADSAQAVLEREEALTSRLEALQARGALSHFQAISAFVPSAARQRENYDLLRRHLFADPARLQGLLAAQGFRPEAIAACVADAVNSGPRILEPEEWLRSPMATPFRHLWVGRTRAGFASVVLPVGFASVAVLEEAARDLPGVTVVDKVGSVTRLFRRYRQYGAGALGLALVLVYLVLCVRYGWVGSAGVLLPTALGMGASLACFGYAGVPMTLFNVMALLLVLGVGVNYAIFLCEGGQRLAATLVGVVLSALTAILSFGLLALSGTPALQRFGLTLGTGIAFSMLLAPTVLSMGVKPRPIRMVGAARILTWLRGSLPCFGGGVALLGLLAALTCTGCGGAPAYRYALQPTTAVAPYATQQKVDLAFGSHRETLICNLEVDGQGMRMACLTPLGQRLLQVQYDNRQSSVDAVFSTRALDPRELLNLIQLAAWPAASVRVGLGDARATLVEGPGRRQIDWEGRPVLTIDFEGEAPVYRRVVVRDAIRGLTLTVTTLDEVKP